MPAAWIALSERTASDLREAIQQAASPSPALAFAPSAIAVTVIGLTAPVVGIAAVAAVVAAVVQSGGVVSFRKLAPRLDRLDVAAGLARSLSAQRMFAALRGAAFAAGSAGIAYVTLRTHLADVVRSAGRLDGILTVTASLARTVAVRAAAMGLLLAAVDVVATRAAWRKRHRMTKADVERERRESDGDPELRAARQRAHRDMLLSADVANVAAASVVVVGSRVACALRYDEASGAAPVVIASGVGDAATRIVEAARGHGAPVVRDEAISRKLADIEVGGGIPEALYEPVAEILRDAWDAPRDRPDPDG